MYAEIEGKAAVSFLVMVADPGERLDYPTGEKGTRGVLCASLQAEGKIFSGVLTSESPNV
jgi:hypothetical protein